MLWSAIFLVSIIGAHSSSDTLSTSHGTLQGTVADGVRRFVGVPFASPPVGKLRFRPPVGVRPWRGVKPAKELPNSCWQTLDESFDRFPGVEMWNPNTPRSEDCLYLNAWIPDTATPNKPIIVWIYGGGFWAGTSTLKVYDPTAMVRMKDVIVVSMNYRLGPFGYLYAGTPQAPGNAGMLDQVMAMEWVKRNAANMGGDPEKITIMGESAGAASVGYHLLSPLSKGLFNNAIMMSSSAYVDWGIKSKRESLVRFNALAKKLGCKRGKKAKNLVKCLLRVPAEKLANEQWSVVDGTYFDLPFALITGDAFLPKAPQQLMPKAKRTSVIAGVVHDEGIFWLLYGFQNVFKLHDPNPVNEEQYQEVLKGILTQHKATSKITHGLTDLVYRLFYPPKSRPSNLDVLDDISGDILFKCAVRNFASEYSALDQTKTYVYSYNYRLSNNAWPKYLGIPHGYEIEAFMGLPYLLPGNYSDDDRAVSLATMNRITNFARTGDPNNAKGGADVSSDTKWPEFNMATEEYLAMDLHSSVKDGLRHEECAYWNFMDHAKLVQEYKLGWHTSHSRASALAGMTFMNAA